MCPGCVEVLALLIVGLGSSGGAAALIAGKLRGEKNDGGKETVDAMEDFRVVGANILRGEER
jgi:uncharacterized protein YoaH (UPF0181 family)